MFHTIDFSDIFLVIIQIRFLLKKAKLFIHIEITKKRRRK